MLGMANTFLFLWSFASVVVGSFGTEPVVWYISPRTGSLAGGAKIYVFGRDFANDQFSFQDPTLGNRIQFCSSKHCVDCDIIQTDVSKMKVGCEIRPPPDGNEGKYNLMMHVNGREVTNKCSNRPNHCIFEFYKWSTATLDSFFPRAGVTGTPVEICGKIHTTQFSRLSPGFSPASKEITRVYVGLECDPFNKETNELFGAYLNDCGWVPNCQGCFKCLPKARTAASHTASYLVSGLGRSQVDKNLWRVDRDQELYLYQTHSDITGAWPSAGSVYGGTEVTATGVGFNDNPKNVKVFVAGVPCEVLSSTFTTITFRTGPRGEAQTLYQGSRGFLHEFWTSTVKANLLDIASLTSDAEDYVARHLTESKSPEVMSVNRTSGSASKVSGFFELKEDNNCTFYIRSNGKSELYLNQTGEPSGKTKIASCSSPASDWNSGSVQASSRIALEANKPYYLEALTDADRVSIRVRLDKTEHTNSKVGSAVDETQQITITSTIDWEKQILDFSNWNENENVCEEQEISIERLDCEENNITNCSDNFTLSYHNDAITISLEEINSTLLVHRLNELQAFQDSVSINVTSVNITEGNATVFRVSFCSNDPRRMEVLNGTVAASHSLQLNITRAVKGQTAKDFHLVFDQPDLPSKALNPSLSITSIKNVLKDWFSTKCHVSPTGYWFYQTYEGEVIGSESGGRSSDIEAYCGRNSSKNPSTLWRAGYTYTELFRDAPQEPYRISRYKYFCFAYKGPVKDEVKFQVNYGQEGNPRYRHHTLHFQRFVPRSDWGFSCINVWDFVQKEYNEDAPGVLMNSIQIVPLEKAEGDRDIYIDEVWIGKTPLSVTRTTSGAKPNGFVVKDFQVEKTGSNWTISLLPAKCGSPLPLLAVVDAARGDSTRDRAKFTVKGLTSNVQVTRLQEASPRVRGTFEIEYNGKVLQDVPANISNVRLEDRLEEEFEEGIMAVERQGTCAGYQWKVTWKTRGGNHPEMQVRGDGLTGNQVSIAVQTLQDGGLFLDPIPGDFLRIPSASGEVVVVVNGITGSCNGKNCSFDYSNEQTPQLTSVSPSFGPGGPQGTGTILILSGSGFSTLNEENVVTIGGSECVIQTSAVDNITCRADYGPGGSHEVKILVKGKGVAGNDQRLNFTYIITATSVTPSSGSTAGGQEITINGSGFGNKKDRASVSLNGSACDIIHINMSHIMCRTSAHAPGSVSVHVSVDGSSTTASNAFHYDASLNIQVTSVKPLQGSVRGGDLITINGSGFLNTTVVKVGEENCVIQSFSSRQITCLTSRHAPGKFPVKVVTRGKGFAVTPEEFKEFEYVFVVHSIFPRNGSIAGGTHVVFKGRGFICNDSRTAVKIHGKPCKIIFCNATDLKCETAPLFKTVVVENTGSHQTLGRGYEWSPKHVTCYQGDTVEWKWSGQAEAIFSVFRTTDSSSVNYDGFGFRSDASKKGTFKHRFREPGVYYYAGSGSASMKGVIRVLPHGTQRGPITIKIDGYEALYNLTSISDSSLNCDSGRIDAVQGCNSSAAEDPGPSKTSFIYNPCSTSKVFSVSPAQGTSGTVITVRGKGFSDESCHNKVTFNAHVCQVIFSNESMITCRLSTVDSPPTGERFVVSVKVINRGFAFVSAASGKNTSFALKPSITAVSPSTGSKAGGTRLTISGSGFSDIKDYNVVRIGDSICDVMSSSYTSIVCITRASNNDQQQQIFVTVKSSSSSECVAADSAVCKYSFSEARTPIISTVSPNSIASSQPTELRFHVSGLPSQSSDVTVKVGTKICNVTVMDSNSLLKCEISGVVAGNHTILVNVLGKGNARFDSGISDTLTSEPKLNSISPEESSINGELTVTINGNGFDPTPGKTSVTIGGGVCKIVSVTYGQIKCLTPPHAASSSVTLQVTVSSNVDSLFPPATIAFTTAATPVVSSLLPTNGKGGDTMTLSGTRLDPLPSHGEVKVRIGDASCGVTSSAIDNVICTLASHAAGSNTVRVLVPGKGKATTTGISFQYSLDVTSVSPNQSGFGGGNLLTIQGHGFNNTAVITICGNECSLRSLHATTTTQISCEAPVHPNYTAGVDQSCDVVINLNGLSSTLPGGFTYRTAFTSQIASVTPSRGGTGGGTTLTIRGNGFSNSQNDNVVTIDGTPCQIITATSSEIVCRTGSHSRTIESKVRVDVGTNGKALDANGCYFYVDVWSSQYTWGNAPPPREGEVANIKKGQTILLDIDTPVLKLLLIQGGKLIFDMEKPSLHLQAENILITDKGALQVGTEDDPFPGNATITLHGHVRSREIPVFGTKTLALREGTLDLHGMHVPITWTHLSTTADVGDTELHLMKEVTWKRGDQIILAPTGKSQREFEELTITDVTNNNRTLHVTPALRYRHISIVQTFNGIHTVETRAEVGLLTRNVRIRGSRHAMWNDKIEACAKDFAPGQFQTQTCFQGKFGEEIGSDEFGVQIMIHAPEESKDLIAARFSYVEISHAGQAFRLGRYPIHFHLSGDVRGSYVRGCAIHHSFNRAITMHGIHNLHVSHNVVFNVRGNAYFMEDGIETGNVLEYNLGIFVIASSSALNVDITPATYWVTNANNTVRHNAAAGGSHFGFWYQMFKHPDGPSFTPNYCPRNVFMYEFINNSAHSFGRYGLWIFPTYHPLRGGRCNSQIAKPAVFGSFIAYNNMRGAEAVQVGAVQMHDFKVLDNDIAGIEYVFADQMDTPWGGPRIVNALIVGHSQASEGLELKIKSNTICTESGIRLPQFSKLIVENVTFVNFNRTSCTCYSACAQCKEFKKRGGWTTRTLKNHFVNSPRRAALQWSHEAVIADLDGSLTGYINGSIVPSNGNLPPQHCSYSPQDSFGPHNGSVCNSKVKFRRFAFNRAAPSSLEGKNILFTNQYGTSVSPYCQKCATHKLGWVALLIVGENYTMTFEDASQITNITYSGSLYEMEEWDHIWINHNLTQRPDFFTTTNFHQNMTDIVPSADAKHGSWSFANETKVFTYIASGKSAARTLNNNIVPVAIRLRVYKCYYKKCITPVPPPPPKGRPSSFRRWSKVDDWEGTEPMYGGYGRRLPKNGSDVMIQKGWYMLADMQLPYLNKLLIYGTLEIEDLYGEDMVINATLVFVAGGLIVGWPDKPYLSSLLISLRGNVNSEEYEPTGGLNVGSKAIAVFGYMWLHGKPKSVCWTRLAATATAGDLFLILEKPVDWDVGDEIVITSSTVFPRQTEKSFIAGISQDKRNLTLNAPLLYKHIAETHTAGNWSYTLAAEVGRLTRNIIIEGADNPAGALTQQSFGCRVLVAGTHASTRIEYVEIRHCGQEGWIDDFDPRFSLALVNIGDVNGNESYVRCNAIHDGFNPGIGVFQTNNLTLEDNIVHHTVGSSIQVAGKFNRVLRNLAVYSISIQTYKGRQEHSLVHFPGAIEVHKATDVILINNTVAGSERFGFKIDGVKCTSNYSPENSTSSGNVVHGAWHGIHLHYEEGIKGCSMIAGYSTWRNLDYGAFIYPESSVIVDSVIAVDNAVGLFPNVWGPHALQHKTADKYFILRNSLIVGTSPNYECDDSVPYARQPYVGRIGARKAPGGGNIGITMTNFGSAPANGPLMRWESPLDYPGINGHTLYREVTFVGFQTKCGKRHRAIMSNSWAGDIMHPIDVLGLRYDSVDEESKLLFERASLALVNPSDCVDMDCDGRRQLNINDLDGSFVGSPGDSVISMAEYEWDGDRRFGLGDYRIPKPALTAVDGARLNVSLVAPHKGIVRGTRDRSKCSWYAGWNAYKCNSLNYRMLVIESLDKDTETRRLSPVALIANGYVNLLNGPQDHGWCLGYTCQERISTFYGIVATGTNYSLYFTSNEPQKIRLHLLNSDSTDVIRLGLFYQRPQRQDVYKGGAFMNPTNGQLGGSEFTTIPKPVGAPDDYFVPPLTSYNGDNYFDRKLSTLFVILRGSQPIDIRVKAVVQVQIGARAVSIDDFFKENLLNNLVALLGIDPSRVRIVDIVSESSSRRRRKRSSGNFYQINIEIGDPPSVNINVSSSSPSNSSGNYTGVNSTLSVEELKEVGDNLVEKVQTGELSEKANLDVVSLSILDPIPEPVDPTGGVRATNETGGPNITDNSTLRYDQLQAQQEAEAPSNVFSFLIPNRLVIVTEPNGGNETVPFTIQPKLKLVDIDGKLVTVLGHGSLSNWTVTASILDGTGDSIALLEGNVSVTIVEGWANFTDLSITHNGTGYKLLFNVSKPAASRFNATSQPFEVKERIMLFTVTVQPDDANETISFGQQPRIEVRDAANGEIIDNTGWKGRRWVFKASLANPNANEGHLNGTTEVEFSKGVAQFTNLSVDVSGENYVLSLEALTVPSSWYVFNDNSSAFNVSERLLYLKVVQQPGDCNDTVICGRQPILEVRNVFPDTLVENIGWRGRIWQVNASIVGVSDSVLNGTTLVIVPMAGRVEFQDLNFYDVAQGYQIQFTVITEPSSSYSGLSSRSETFDVRARLFYLEVITQPAQANQSELFGVSPVVEVRDLGTRMRAHPLKGQWTIAVSLKPTALNGTLSGVLNLTVTDERVEFSNLSISYYGVGYELIFESSYGHVVYSQPFEVKYVNDYSPEFDPSNGYYNATVPENVPIGVSVTTVTATDQDSGSQGDVSYSIVAGNTGNKFAVNALLGNISTIGDLDRETTAVFTLTVRASDGAVPEKVRYTDGTVEIVISDINDNAPSFNTSSIDAPVQENASIGDVVITLQANDRDAGTNSELRYSITSGNPAGIFTLDSITGQLKVNASIDLEQESRPDFNHSLVILVEDMGIPQKLNSSVVLNISIEAVNEFTPQLTHNSQFNFSFPENADVGDGVFVFQVNATDQDFGEQGVVFYVFYSGNEDGKFTINATTGELKLVSALDYENTSSYTLIIHARDSENKNAVFAVHVSVLDMNDNTPKFSQSQYEVNINEDTVIGSSVFTFLASDPDSGLNGLVSYSLAFSNASEFWSLNSSTGELTVKAPLDMDSQQISSWTHTLIVTAHDAGTPILNSNATLIVHILLTNEFAPSFPSADVSVTVSEDIAEGTTIYNANATDADFGSDGEIKYSIRSGNNDLKFYINFLTGQITTLATLDRESQDVYHLEVEATDSAASGLRKTGTTTVHLSLRDVNDNTPTFSKSQYDGVVLESSTNGEGVLHVHATDRDLGTNGKIIYSIESGNDQGYFSIEANQGIIRTAKSLDIESQNHLADHAFTLVVLAKDQGTPESLNNSVTVTLKVQSVNEFAPVLIHLDNQVIELSENASVTQVVFDVNATDQDYGADGLLTYSITDGNGLGTFAIDNVTGVITLEKQLDFETIRQHNLVISITDNSQNVNERRQISAHLQIQVININDSVPYTAEVEMLRTYIASPENPAGLAGITDRSALEIRLLYANGTTMDITNQSNRYTLDDISKSNGLFSVVVNDGAPFVVANRIGLSGLGKLLVHITNVKTVEVNVTIIGGTSLSIKAVSFPEIANASEVAELKQVISGRYQRVLLKVFLNLTNSDQVDVSVSVNTSFAFTNAHQFGRTYEFGPDPRNLFSIIGHGLSGSVTLQAVFSRSLSANVNLTLSSTILKVVTINRFGLKNVSNTLSGVALLTTAQPFAEVQLEDGSIHLLDNFTMYNGLLTFLSSDAAVASVNQDSGVVTLLSEGSTRITITATAVANASLTAVVSFYCNLEPRVGEVDIGDKEGPAIPSLATNEAWTMSVRMNPGKIGILAVQVEIWFNSSDLELVNINTDLPYSLAGNTINIFGPVAEAKALLVDLAEVLFTSLRSGVPQVNYRSFRTVDKNLTPVPSKVASSCSSAVYGDIDLDCTFDIVDVAFINAYISSSQSQFSDTLGSKMAAVLSSQKRSMDVNWNEVIESKDASFLSFIYLNKAKFVAKLTYKIPNNRDNSVDKCALEMTVELANKDGSLTSSAQAEVYFLFSHAAQIVAEQFSKTTFTAGTKVVVKGSPSIHGMIKTNYENGKYFVAAKNSEIESSNVGISIVQSIPFNGQRFAVPMFLASPLVSSGVVDVSWVRNQANRGFTPQRILQFSESTTTCSNKLQSSAVIVVITFEGDYDTIVSGKKVQFESYCVKALSDKYPGVTIISCTASKGSIVVAINMTVAETKLNSTIAKIWEDVRTGLKLHFNGTTIVTLPKMLVDGKEYGKEPVQAPNVKSSMSVYIIIIACLALFVVILFIVIVLYCLHRRKRKLGKINPTPPTTPEGNYDDSKVKKDPEIESKYVAASASSSMYSLQQTVDSAFRRPTPIAFTDPIEPAFEEHEVQFLNSKKNTPGPKGDSIDRPATVLAFPVVPSKNLSRSPSPRPPSKEGTESTDFSESPDIASSEISAQSPPVSPSGLWSTRHTQSKQEDEFNEDGMGEIIRQEAVLRRRTSSIDSDTEHAFETMPGVSADSDPQLKRRKMEIKVIRPNSEIGVLAHMAGVVNVFQSGTLRMLREDISRALPTYLGSLKYLFISRKFKIIDPRTENQLIVSGIYKKTIYVKVFHGADNCEYFCLCGKVAYTWCPKCNVQGYCGDDCRKKDESEHAKSCSSTKGKTLQSARSRRISRDKK